MPDPTPVPPSPTPALPEPPLDAPPAGASPAASPPLPAPSPQALTGKALALKAKHEIERAGTIRDGLYLRELLGSYLEMARATKIEGLRNVKVSVSVRELLELVALAIPDAKKATVQLVKVENLGELLAQAAEQTAAFEKRLAQEVAALKARLGETPKPAEA